MDNGNFKATVGDLTEELPFGTAAEVLNDCEVTVDIETNTREYSNESGQAMSKLTFTIDLSKMRHPWQPHMDQAWDMAHELTLSIIEQYQGYLENADFEVEEEE